jgi:Delta3-Delta2-enoyl-CoA isomerase
VSSYDVNYLFQSAKSIFSGGFDIKFLGAADRQAALETYRKLVDLWIKLYGAKFVTATAVNGHAIAGGCVLALCCDHRVMLPNTTIGLNEIKIGMNVPDWIRGMYRNVLPAHADKALKLGTVFNTQKALQVGLVDEIAADKAEALAKCEAFIQKHQGDLLEKHIAMKNSIRGPLIQTLKDTRKADEEAFIDLLFSMKFRSKMYLYLAMLSMRSVFSGKSKKSSGK